MLVRLPSRLNLSHAVGQIWWHKRLLSSFHRIEPDSSLHPFHQDMTTPINPHRRSYYQGTEQGTGGHYAWQPYQNARLQAMVPSQRTHRTLGADNVSPSSVSPLEAQNNLSIAETAFDDGFAGPVSSVNGFLDFSGNYEFMLPLTRPSVPLGSQFDELNILFPSMHFPDTLSGLPSTVDTCSHSTLNQIAMSEDRNNSVWSTGPSAPANYNLLPTYAGCFPSFLLYHGSD